MFRNHNQWRQGQALLYYYCVEYRIYIGYTRRRAIDSWFIFFFKSLNLIINCFLILMQLHIGSGRSSEARRGREPIWRN